MEERELTLDERIQREEDIRNNKVATFCHMFVSVVIAVAYVLEFVKGDRTLPYTIAVLALAMASPIIEQIMLKKDPATKSVRRVLMYGFGIFYSFILLTTNNQLAFVYVMPLFYAVLVWNDARLLFLATIVCTLVNIVQVVFYCATGRMSWAEDSATIEIQILVMIIVSVYMLLVSRVLTQNNQKRREVIVAQAQETEANMQVTLDVSNEMAQDIETVGLKMDELNRATLTTKESMGEVNAGATDTAEAVQTQITLTNNIQNRVDDVKESTGEILESVRVADEAIRTGSENIERLVSQVEASIESGREVTAQLQELQQNMENIHSVVGMISSITQQTTMLSLNASIEAARAGESGKGFAVVATEMTKMADETGQATNQISAMLNDFSETIKNVVNVTTTMIQQIDDQHASTEAAAQSFNEIQESTKVISNRSTVLQEGVENLAEANHEIVDSISTISSVSEEVAAHANTTYDISERNAETVEEITALIDELNSLASKLK